MDIEEIKSVVQDKFSSSDKVTAILCDAKVLHPEWVKNERILAIVENDNEKAVFCLFCSRYPPKTFPDLSVEIILPVDKSFKCDIDNKPSDSETILYLNIQSRNNKLKFEIQMTPQVGAFVDELFRGLESAEKATVVPEFMWLQKYSSKDDTNISPTQYPRQVVTVGQNRTARENRIKFEMQMKESYFTYTNTFTIFTTTWNVNDKTPVIPLDNWLNVESEPPDIYAVGFQELDLSKETFLFDQTPKEEEWYRAVLSTVNKKTKYIDVKRVRLVGMLLIILIKEKHIQYVHNVDCVTVGTGIMGKMGNKGGVTIRFEFHNTSLCFVNSHLAAHVEEFERRNQDFRDICNRTHFRQTYHDSRSIKDHDQIYWIGDLNYRITELDPNTVKKYIEENNLLPVLEWDQLNLQHKQNNVFFGYTEGPIKFRPTYKYDPGTDNWDSSEKNRAPAWCDRIFWKGEGIKQLVYRSHPSINISDHKPVSATFQSEIKIIDEEKYRKIYEEVIKKLDKLENELIPQVTVDQTDIDFGVVKYLELQVRSMTIANTGQVLVEFEFIKKLDETSFCKEWLLVEPHKKYIYPGETCNIQLKVLINKTSACKMNSGSDKLYDILVLHLEGGKDIFVTVSGTYERSCFGCSIEALVNLKVPIQAVPFGKLLELENKRDSALNPSAYAIPKEIWYLVDHIYLHGLKEPNLFEQPGLHLEVVKIRDWLDSGSVEPMPGSIHSVVEALLLLLESTAEPIIPYNLHSHCLSSCSNYIQCKQIVMQLPECRKNVFLYLCEFLKEALKYSPENGLDVKTLSTLFGQIFLRDNPCHHQEITRPNKQIIDRKKAFFVQHFLANDHNELLVSR